VQAKIIKLVGLKNSGRLSPIDLVTFAGTQDLNPHKTKILIWTENNSDVSLRVGKANITGNNWAFKQQVIQFLSGILKLFFVHFHCIQK
jgi:hypothetical protein